MPIVCLAMKEWNYKNIAISKDKHRKLADLSSRFNVTMKELIEVAIERLHVSMEPGRKRKGKSSDKS